MSTETTTREEHLKWAKARAIQYAKAGDNAQALASIGSDLNKHPETRGHIAVGLGLMMLMGGHLSTQDEMVNFIEGFN